MYLDFSKCRTTTAAVESTNKQTKLHSDVTTGRRDETYAAIVKDGSSELPDFLDN